MGNFSNRSALRDTLKQVEAWDYAEGNDFDFDDAFSNSEGQSAFEGYADDGEMSEAAGQNNQLHSCRVKRPVSMPYLYSVTNASTSSDNLFVNMFGAEVNNGFNNFGNNALISFNYLLSGYFGGGAAGYSALLYRTIAQTFSIGRIRMESTTTQQLSVPLNITDSDPTGKSIVYPAIQFAKLNQFITYAVETELDMTIYGGTQLTYLQYGSTAATTVTWYLWAADIASLTRALEGKPAFKELRRPDTYLNQTIKFERAQAAKALSK